MALQSFRQYAPKKLQVYRNPFLLNTHTLQCLSIIYSFLAHIALIAILLNRKHYTIDVVFGYAIHLSNLFNPFSFSYLVSTRVFTEYHSVAISYHDGNLSRNPLSSFLWTNLIPYLERDVPPPHLFSNQLECPSDCLPLFGRYRGERK